jgi:hypothetical protein
MLNSLQPTQDYRVQANNILYCRAMKSEDDFRRMVMEELQKADINGQNNTFVKETAIYPPRPKKK